MTCGMENLTSVLHVFILRVIWSVKQMNYPRKRSPTLPENGFTGDLFFVLLTAEDLGERLQHLTLDSLLFGVFCADVAIALAELDFVPVTGSVHNGSGLSLGQFADAQR